MKAETVLYSLTVSDKEFGKKCFFPNNILINIDTKHFEVNTLEKSQKGWWDHPKFGVLAVLLN